MSPFINLAVLITLTHLANSVELGQKCFDDIGCFSMVNPFNGLKLQGDLSLERLNTVYSLYTRTNKNAPINLAATKVKTSLQKVWPGFAKRPTKIIVHGYSDGVNKTTWQKEMKNELLAQGDYNVILVDWSVGADEFYTSAAFTTIIVGKQTSTLINAIIRTHNVPAKDFHIIGHSLGAHVAGNAGQGVVGLGRISGLDPASPLFSDLSNAVRLDPTDASFVDVIHTYIGVLIPDSGIGITDPMGHVDFYPNSGYNQPGCFDSTIKSIKDSGLSGAMEAFKCSHNRAYKLFTESINSRCRFKSYPCAKKISLWFGLSVKINLPSEFGLLCNSCDGNGCANMGFWADKNSEPGIYYLKTSGQAPYCLS
ncbi:inactive pancreatic lipase-related protein 1-like [Physella acuta]|uniref:inactive pancreatic lipase-related protein 1-like n=1 Tax=Physella acuta TaxID=109671 RepID=UPI0027DDE7C4|nr:inactive pancreatic lipase-related protein 1-like [Physella acuta]